MRRYVSVFVILVCIGALASMAQAATWPNEPPGSTVVTENPFNPGYFPCNNCFDSNGWLDVYGTGQIIQNPRGMTTPYSPTTALGCTYSPSPAAANSSCMTVTFYDWAKRTNDVYVGFWVMISPEMVADPGLNGTKLMIAFASKDSSAYTFTPAPTLQRAGTPNFILGVYVPTAKNIDNCHLSNRQGGCPGSMHVLGNNLVFTPGVWHRAEGHFKPSTTETSKDGIIQMWVDGQVAMDYRNVNTDGGYFFDYHAYPGAWGNATQPGVQIWYDHFRISDVSTSGTPPPVDTVPPAPPGNLQVSTP